MTLKWLLITSDKDKEHNRAQRSLSHNADCWSTPLSATLQMYSNWSTICQHSHLYCLPTHLIGWWIEMISPENRRCDSDEGTGQDRVSSVHCWTTGNDGASVARAQRLTVIVSGSRLRQGWVTQAPNVNHCGQLVWLNSPRRRDQTVLASLRSADLQPPPPPTDHVQFRSDHPSLCNFVSVTLCHPAFKKLIGQMTEMSLCARVV